MLPKIKEAKAQGLSGEAVEQAAFEANMKDIARVGGG